tara:strand:- start:1163 stop:1387 length:225 start_codon:yes stop_codon:yes gene_type:complete
VENRKPLLPQAASSSESSGRMKRIRGIPELSPPLNGEGYDVDKAQTPEDESEQQALLGKRSLPSLNNRTRRSKR